MSTLDNATAGIEISGGFRFGEENEDSVFVRLSQTVKAIINTCLSSARYTLLFYLGWYQRVFLLSNQYSKF